MESQGLGILQVDVNLPPDSPAIVVAGKGEGETPVIWNFSTHSNYDFYKSKCICPNRPICYYRTRTCTIDTYNRKSSISLMSMYGNGSL